HRRRQALDEGIVHQRHDAGLCGVPLRVQIAYGAAELDQLVPIESGKANLYRSDRVEARIRVEVDRQPLGERCEPLHALLTLEERRCSCDHQVETGQTAFIDLVDQLPQRVQTPVARVAPHALERLDLV